MKENLLNEDQPAKKISLLRRYDIPVEHLDFKYISDCKIAKEAEKILTILRSGEEGHYPHLMKCAEETLRNLNPKSRLLREEKPVLRPGDLEKVEREAIQDDLLKWINNISDTGGSGDTGSGNNIFTVGEVSTSEADYIPIRGEETSSINTQNQNPETSNQFLKTPNPNRIKSWEYDKWDKFDIDAELTRLDIQDMQIKEWENSGKSKVLEDQKRVELLMKNKDINESKPKKCEAKEKLQNATNEKDPQPKMASFVMPKVEKAHGSTFSPAALPKSFIEELPMEDEITKKIRASCNKKRVKVIIDDVNIRF